MKIIITYPQIVFETKTIEIPDEHMEELMEDASLKEQASFVYHQLNDIEKSWLPGGKESIISAMEEGYCNPPKPEKCPSTITVITPNGR